MKELYRFRQFLTEGVIKEAYNLPDSDSTTDKYVNNHWDGILKDILRAHTDLRNSKGGESIPERPSQLDIDIVLGRFDGAGEFMDVDPNEYNEYFDFYDMYLVTQRDEENTKDISVEDYPEGDYSGYTKRDDLPKLDEGKLLKEDNLKDYWSEWAAGEVKVGNDDVIDAGGVDADFKDVPDEAMDTFKRYVKAVKTLNADSKELRDDIAGAISAILYDGGGFEDYEFDVLTSDQFDKIN
jgi:hypothetical protein